MSKQPKASCAKRAEAYAHRCAKGKADVPETIRQAYAKWFAYKDKYGLDESKLNAIGDRFENLWLPILLGIPEEKGKLQMSDWQCAMLSWVFGFTTGSDSHRVVSKLHLRTSANLGKTTLAAALCLDKMALPIKGSRGEKTICVEGGKFNTSSTFGKLYSVFKTVKDLHDKSGPFYPLKITQKNIGYGSQFGEVIRWPFKDNCGHETAQLVIVDARNCKVPNSSFIYAASICLTWEERLMLVLSTPEKSPDSKYEPQQESVFKWLHSKKELGSIVALLY